MRGGGEISMKFFNCAIKRAFSFFLIFAFIMISAPSFAQDTDSLDGSTEEDPTDRLIEQYEGTAVGKVLAWLLDEERKYLIVPIASSGPDTGILVGLTCTTPTSGTRTSGI